MGARCNGVVAMALAVPATIVGNALNDFGLEANSTIAGLGLNSFGFLWPCDGIWEPCEADITTVWVACTINPPGTEGC